ncbi:MAG TPA: hypothetical protein VGW38_07695, partial [Chloroflexota bacterium]|nr:hypothetical protein [Chloroflexota bacterium]
MKHAATTLMDDSPRRPPACTPWAAVLEELPLLTRAQLVNGLAVSLGTTALMARRILRNERVGLVAAAVVAAYNALSRSLPLLPP